MPLVRNGRFQPDPFVRIGADWELPIDSVNLGKGIVPFEWLADLANNWPNNSQIGVQIATTITLDELAPHLDRLALVAIGFPAVSDGRGFSIAKALRNRGYRGILRACGPLIADQSRHAAACGFDEIEIPESVSARQPEAQWLAAAEPGVSYQRGYAGLTNILDQRRAARNRSQGDSQSAGALFQTADQKTGD
jgi:uncharacterized protein (DUF934 family)